MEVFDNFVGNPQVLFYIENSKPNQDCEFCKVRNYVNPDGSLCNQKYADCVNPVVTCGFVAKHISFKPFGFGYSCSCQLCKHYVNKLQLSLFD